MKKRMLKKITAVFGGMILMTLCQCSPVTTAQTQGPGTEVIGRVLIPGETEVHGLVFLRRADFLADTAESVSVVPPQAQTDSTGRFSIQGVLPGSYSIEVIDTTYGQVRYAVLLKCEVIQGKSQTELPDSVLKSVSTVSGSILDRGEGMWVQVYGLERLARVDPLTGAFTILDVPEGQYSLHVVGSSPAFTAYDIGTVSAVSGDTTDLPFAPWRFSRQIYFNTTTSGANVAGAVNDFPVLIRLTNSNFNFSQAKAGGDDLRFVNSNGASLAYEIERWDPANGRAEVWVRSDTIFGNDSTQNITMVWGNAAAQGASNSASVFDTAAGFKAVWHFSQDCIDATPNNMNGTNYGTTDTEGIAGLSKLFDGTDSIKIPGPINGPPSIMLSAWVKFDTTDTLGGEVISLGDDALIRVDDPQSSVRTMGSYRYDTSYASFNRTSSGRLLQKTEWRYVAFAIDGVLGIQSLFIDGTLSVSTQFKNPVYYHLGRNISIGTHGHEWNQPNSDFTKCDFSGAIDEVRICRMARSSDWIKLCFMNQKPIDALIVVK